MERGKLKMSRCGVGSQVEEGARPDPRMRGFRIGGQAESAEERGEGWCGPWATAARLIEQRETARLEREAALAEGGDPGGEAPLSPWTPSRDPKSAPPRRRPSAVPSLQDTCVQFLVDNIDCVASFGVLSVGVQAAIAAGLCAVRKLDDVALELLTQADASVTELIVPDCSQVSEEALVAALERLTNAGRDEGWPAVGGDGSYAPSAHGGDSYDYGGGYPPAPPSWRPPLSLVDLGYCGRPFTARVAALLNPLTSLTTLRLRGCFRLTNATLATLMQKRGEGLTELQISGNSQLNADGLASIAAHCTKLISLRLEDCDQLTPSGLAPLSRIENLQTLSLNGLCLLEGDTLTSLVRPSAVTLTTLGLRGCPLLEPDAVAAAARMCSQLTDLNLEGVELLTDAAAAEIAISLPALERLVLKGCVQLSDAAIEAFAENCHGLLELSLNKIPALSDAALVALRRRCTGLTVLDISWCRGVSDHGIGALVDACEGLEKLSLWGCTQLTRHFYDGHSRDGLRVIGRF